MSRFSECLPLILQHEGGYVDHPKDPGGATNLGVTLRTLQEWRGRHVTKAEVRALTAKDVAPIYEARYWRAASCDKLPPGVDYMAFDLAVNSGPGRAARYLQEAVGVNADGAIGPMTLEAVSDADPVHVVRAISARRERFYRSLDTFPTFGKGWLRRLKEVTDKALEMAS